MTYSKKDGFKLDIPNADKIEGEIIGTIWEEISRQIESLLSYGDMYEWEKTDYAVPDIGDRTLEVPVWFPAGFNGKHSDQIQVKAGHIETLDDVKALVSLTSDKADEMGYIEPDFDDI